ncbi:MAG: PHB depolymerase family esterase [Desulfatiglandales bacterium]
MLINTYKFGFFSLILFGLIGMGRADVTKQSLVIGQTTRNYLISLPSTYSPKKRYPLLLVFHGGGGNAEQVLKTSDLLERAEKEKWILVSPFGSGRFDRVLTWNVGFGFGYAMRNKVDDIAFVRRLISSLKSSYSIDPDRVYATGISNGGMLCHMIAAHLSDQIAAIAPIVATAGGRAKGHTQWISPPVPKQPVSVIAFNGALDKSVPAEGGLQKSTFVRKPVELWPIDRSVGFWVEHNQCNKDAAKESNEKKQYERYIYGGGKDGSEVVHYIILNQGHAWPGGRKGFRAGDEPSQLISANELMFEFFKRHPKKAEPGAPADPPEAGR